MKFNIETITNEDVEIAMNYNATFGECSKTIDLVNKIRPKFDCSDPTWDKMCLALYAYKLGEMQGKRAERARHKNNTYCVGGAN